MILVDAMYINVSGGKVLLDYLVLKLFEKPNIFFLFDRRLISEYSYVPETKKEIVSSFFQRHRFYGRHRKNISAVLCFGNVPPSVRLDGRVYTYFHSMHYMHTQIPLPPSVSLLSFLKSNLISFLSKNTDQFIVQTSVVKEALSKNFSLADSRVLVIPFYDEERIGRIPSVKREQLFLYVSSGMIHKNHGNLLDAWEILATSGYFPKLVLTVPETYRTLVNRIDLLRTSGLNIDNTWVTDTSSLKMLYNSSRFLIFPSTMESFGLGLIEGADAGCAILAADLPYTHAVVTPSFVFDPSRAEDIARVVRIALDAPSVPESVRKIENEFVQLENLLT